MQGPLQGERGGGWENGQRQACPPGMRPEPPAPRQVVGRQAPGLRSPPPPALVPRAPAWHTDTQRAQPRHQHRGPSGRRSCQPQVRARALGRRPQAPGQRGPRAPGLPAAEGAFRPHRLPTGSADSPPGLLWAPAGRGPCAGLRALDPAPHTEGGALIPWAPPVPPPRGRRSNGAGRPGSRGTWGGGPGPGPPAQRHLAGRPAQLAATCCPASGGSGGGRWEQAAPLPPSPAVPGPGQRLRCPHSRFRCSSRPEPQRLIPRGRGQAGGGGRRPRGGGLPSVRRDLLQPFP